MKTFSVIIGLIGLFIILFARIHHLAYNTHIEDIQALFYYWRYIIPGAILCLISFYFLGAKNG